MADNAPTSTLKIIQVALGEVGYLEKASNADLYDKTANAGTKNYTKYGKWYGSNGQPWCDMFVSWCAEQADEVDAIGRFAYVPTHIKFFKKRGEYFDKAQIVPRTGDVIFFENEGHVGLVEYVEGSTVHTVEGNTKSSASLISNGGGVFRMQYSMSSSYIIGYARPRYKNSTLYYAAYGSNNGKSKIIFIGDSRTVGMQQVVGSDTNTWCCSKNADIEWMKTTGVPSIENKIDSQTAVCILLGLNDLLAVLPRVYYNYINACAVKWRSKGADTYFVSVNPVIQSIYSKFDNNTIQRWNQNVRNGLNTYVGYIDSYSAIFDSFKSPDGIHYDKNTYIQIYQLLLRSVYQGSISMYGNSAMIGGSPIQIDYMKINPYIVTLDRTISTKFPFDKLVQSRVVGAIVEGGYLYNLDYSKVRRFEPPNLSYQINQLKKNNIEYGLYFTSRATSLEQARSEMKEMTLVIRHFPPRLGVWIIPRFNKTIKINSRILDYFQKQLINLGFMSKIGLYTTLDDLKYIDWEAFQEYWLLWIVDHVDDTSKLETLLDPQFFDVDMNNNVPVRG